MSKDALPKRTVKRKSLKPIEVVSLPEPVKRATTVKAKRSNKVKESISLPVKKARRQTGLSTKSEKSVPTTSIPSPLTPSSVVRERILAKVRADAAAAKSKVKEPEAVSFVSGEPAERLKEKVAIYRKLVDERGPEIMSRVAQVSGYTFIFFGLAFLYAQALSLPQGALKQAASAICVTDSCMTVQNLPAVPELIPEPGLTFLSVPARITEQTMISMQVTNVTDHSLRLVNKSDGREFEITNKRNGEAGRVDYIIGPGSVPTGVYEVRVSITGESNMTRIVTANNPISFLTEDQPSSRQVVAPAADPSTASAVAAAVSGGEVPATSTSLARSTGQSTTTAPSGSPNYSRPTLTITPDTGGLYKISLEGATTDQSTVSLYATLLQSITPTFLGLMYPGNQQYVFWLDGLSLPSGQYEFTAFVGPNTNGEVLAKEKFSHIRTATSTTEVNQRPLPRVESAITEDTAPSANEMVSIGFATALESAPPEPLPGDSKSDALARELLTTEAAVFSSLIDRLAIARETNDENLIRLARREMDAEVRRIVTEASVNELEVGAAALEAALRSRLDSIAGQIDRFQDLTAADQAMRLQDTDSDGISDHDERNLYGTDIYNPDTDGDGIQDGVEIVSGYDPLDPNPEALIIYQSPKEVGYINDTRLGILAVEPLVEYTEDMTVARVQAVIRGFGLPNSFVTLYVYSTPTIITVRTAEDGSFEYVFTKELEDGQHEVYVAITDNTGEIVARSNAFTFVKTAQAFTYSDEAVAASTVSDIDPSVTSVVSYYMVVAMGVVSFGIILLLLGYSLRRKESELLPA